MTNFSDYTGEVAAHQVRLKAEREAKNQARAESERAAIMESIAATVPIFWNRYSYALEHGKSAWWNSDPKKDRYGMPGIVIWGHLFIGRWRDADCYRLYVGCWSNQNQWTNNPKSDVLGVKCRGKIAIEEMDQQRLDVESAFGDRVSSAISLITARGNQGSFPSWTGPTLPD